MLDKSITHVYLIIYILYKIELWIMVENNLQSEAVEEESHKNTCSVYTVDKSNKMLRLIKECNHDDKIRAL